MLLQPQRVSKGCWLLMNLFEHEMWVALFNRHFGRPVNNFRFSSDNARILDFSDFVACGRKDDEFSVIYQNCFVGYWQKCRYIGCTANCIFADTQDEGAFVSGAYYFVRFFS